MFPTVMVCSRSYGAQHKIGTTLKKFVPQLQIRVVPMLQGGERRQVMKLCIGLIDN